MAFTFPEYESFDGLGLANLIQRGILSPEEVLDAAIERVQRDNPKINAIINTFYDKARASIQDGLPQGPFYGVPFVLKDLLADYKDTLKFYGSRFAYNHKIMSLSTSELVKRFLEAGLVIFGKTNVPEFGLSPFTEPELFGPSHNPWNLDYICGGSSGGSAAVVASRMLPMAHGGDGGGSIRIPASYTGIFGFKPSRGRTPIGPMHVRIWLGMVVEHVLTRSVRDSAAMLDVLSGPELGSPISLSKPSIPFLKQIEKPPRSLSIGLIKEPFFKADVNAEYADYLKNAGLLCESLGHRVEEAKLEFEGDLHRAFFIIMMAETAASMKALVKDIGHRPKSDELEQMTAILCHAGEEFSAAEYVWAIQVIDKAGQVLAQFFQKYDALLSLTMPFPAPKIGSSKPMGYEKFMMSLLRYLPYGPKLRELILNASTKKYSFMAFTALFNMGGQPAMSVPLYWDKNNMPVGIQFAADWQNDGLLLQLARQLEEAQPWQDRIPELFFSDRRQMRPKILQQ